MKTDRTYIIAEAGVNHNGSPEMARQLVDAAAAAGADAVKFQVFQAAKLTCASAARAPYQAARGPADESQQSMLAKLELSRETFIDLAAQARSQGIEFLATPFDEESLALLVGIGVNRLKVSSGDLTTGPLLLAIARAGLPTILSTGMSDLEEIRGALAVLSWGFQNPTRSPESLAQMRSAAAASPASVLAQKLILMQCTTDYPCAYENANVRVMDSLAREFGLPVGFSDHTPGYHVSLAAVARGAKVIEKHFTLDRTLPGPDHHASLHPDELADMIRQIREVETALGTGEKIIETCELNNKTAARKSLVSRTAIGRDEVFSLENLECKRPGDGVPGLYYWDYLGRKAGRDYQADTAIVR